ncbi:MAG: hypothetical protein LUD47_06170 [Clostridia bacterium]|nr:hypothetical protein [Clostridia bacterium]
MIEEVLNYLHNYFCIDVYSDLYTVQDGKIELPFLTENQYFRIVGSIFNDGVYQYTDELELKDETFDGSIWALAVPPALVTIIDEISAWQAKYGEITASPYTSESFGGYSYTKSANASTESAMNWKTIFGDRLDPYRKAMDMTNSAYAGHQDPPFHRPFNPGWSL